MALLAAEDGGLRRGFPKEQTGPEDVGGEQVGVTGVLRGKAGSTGKGEEWGGTLEDEVGKGGGDGVVFGRGERSRSTSGLVPDGLV